VSGFRDASATYIEDASETETQVSGLPWGLGLFGASKKEKSNDAAQTVLPLGSIGLPYGN